MRKQKRSVDPPEPVGKRIKLFREERGLTASALAEAAGLSKSYLSELEADETQNRRPSADTLYRIAKALGVAMSDLLGRPIITSPSGERPKSLLAFAKARRLPESDIAMLASISFRGDQPNTVERWAFIYDAIRNSEPMDRAAK